MSTFIMKELKLSTALQSEIIDFLKSLPNLDATSGRQAIVYSATSDSRLRELISFDMPSAQFIPLLVATLNDYGDLDNGQHALEAVLSGAKNFVGKGKQAYCETLIQKVKESYVSEEKRQPSEKISKVPSVHLRSQQQMVSVNEASMTFNAKKKGIWFFSRWEPFEIDRKIENDFEVQEEVILDYTTGLMWQQAGSEVVLPLAEAQRYITTLNERQFAGCNNWRLPTIEELLSLLEPERQQPNGLYLDPIFASRQQNCWSIDMFSPEAAWVIWFSDNVINWSLVEYDYYVRGVSFFSQEALSRED